MTPKPTRAEGAREPQPDSELMVLAWSAASSISHHNVVNNGKWLTAKTIVEQAESLLRAKFRVYKNLKSYLPRKLQTLQYSVPATLYDHIQMIQPTTFFGFHQQTDEDHSLKGIDWNTNLDSEFSRCNVTVTPPYLRRLYNITETPAVPSTSTWNFLRVTGFLEQYARYADVHQLISTYASYASSGNFSWVSINSELSPTTPTPNAN
jgi:tripeptidyl-peptidase I